VARWCGATASRTWALVVVHDELDLPVGRLKVKVGGGLAGHNGLRSIKAHLHDDDFVRVRIGVGKPRRPAGADHVLRRRAKPSGPSSTSWSRRRPTRSRSSSRRRFDAAMARYNAPSQPGRLTRALTPLLPVCCRRTLRCCGARPTKQRVRWRCPSRPAPSPSPRSPARRPIDPLVVGVPTTADAEHLAERPGRLPRRGPVEVFPAWETLPFERVSPSVETMGQRLRVLWHLRTPSAPRGCSSLRPARWCSASAPAQRATSSRSWWASATRSTRRAGRTSSSPFGYRREYQVEHRGEVAVRGSIVDVFPSTATAPVRIDLWGDEVDRLSEFSVADQRSTIDRSEVEIFPARELLPTDEVRERAAALVGAEPWGREQWERLAEGQVFDGMESWLPWLVDDEQVVLDLVGADAQVVLVEPRRCATVPPTSPPRSATWPSPWPHLGSRSPGR
jgi:hypothetical protein